MGNPLLVLVYLLLLASTSQATDPFPYTWVQKKKTEWEVLHGYLGGAAIVVENQPANKKERLWLSDMIAPAEFQKYVGNSTAGPIWEREAFWYFITIDNKPHLGIRLGWGSRILIDVEGYRAVDPGKHHAVLETHEKKLVIERLQDAVKLMRDQDATLNNQLWNYRSAMHHAVSFKLVESIPLLQELERYPFEKDLQAMMEKSWAQDPFIPASYTPCLIRRTAQYALRRLGQTPQGLPALHMIRPGEFQQKPADQPVLNKAELIHKIHKGMHAGQVLNLIGPPDYINPINNIDLMHLKPVYWRYEIDGTSPGTWLITIHKTEVQKVQEFNPPVWQMEESLVEKEGRRVFQVDGDLEWGMDWERISMFYLKKRSLTTGLVLAGTLLVIVVCAILMRRKHLQRLAAR